MIAYIVIPIAFYTQNLMYYHLYLSNRAIHLKVFQDKTLQQYWGLRMFYLMSLPIHHFLLTYILEASFLAFLSS